ncbi:MAG: hypothetical protein J6D28_01135 [Bacilli bacterium]|nr:hypothetical protein [Bacilli bacterium]
MRKKFGMKLKKIFSAIFVFGIALASLPSSLFVTEVHALSNVSGDKIIEVAQSYSNWGYGEVGTCTGLVTRTLNKLGIGTSIVGIHPYDINTKQPDGTGARYAPLAMYNNAMKHPEDAKHIWSGYAKDVKANAHLFKNGDLIIERPEDKANYDGNGHVGFLHIYSDKISMYGANGYTYGIGDAVLATGVTGLSLMGSSININGMNYINVFRLTEVEPIYETLDSTKTAEEKVEVTIHKTDVETGKALSGVEVDFYRDGEKFASGVTDENGNAHSTSIVTHSSTSSPKTYVTNWDDLGDAGKAEVDERGAYHSRLEAQAAADAEAQSAATQKASQKHTYTVIETKTKTKYWLNPNNTTVSDTVTGSGSVEMNLTNERVTGTAYLYKEDADVKHAQNEAEIDGAVYGLFASENILDPADGSIIYNKGTEITRVRIADGTATVDNLYLGDYEWRELTPSVGYSLDTTSHKFSLNYANQDTKLVTNKTTSKENVIIGDFDLEKVITSGDESEIVEKEEGAEFLVVAKKYVDKYGSIEEAWEHKDEFTNKEYDKLVTSNKGYAKSKMLAFGTFIVKQVKGKEDTDMVKNTWEFKVSRENQETIKYIINNRNFTSYVKLVKRDKDTEKLITLSNTTFKIKNADTGEYLKQKVADKTYDTWKTSDKGYFQLPLEVSAGNWILEEIESPDFYIINEEGLNFKVTNTNIVEVDGDGDPILTVTMYDKAVKGQIKVEKKGEVLTGIEKDKDNNIKFVYEEKCLAGMTVNIQADEDIIDVADGSILYHKGDIVDTVTTTCQNEDLSNLLPLGHYVVYETEAPKGMIIDTKKYNVNLEFKDNKTEVILDNISITNKRQKVELNLTKLDLDRETPLEGVIFNLKAVKDILSYDGEVLVNAGTIIESGKTDSDGKYVFNADLPLSFDDDIYFELSEGKALEGYYENDEVISIDTKYKGQNIEKISNSQKIYNEAIKNYILINKVDDKTLENIISKDFSFRLCKDANCEEVVGEYNANQENGTALIPVYFGTWYVSEYKAPEGYSISSEVVKITLNEEGLFINDELVETDEDLLYSIKYQDKLLPAIQINNGVQTGYEDNKTMYIALGCLSLAGVITVMVTLFKKKKRK